MGKYKTRYSKIRGELTIDSMTDEGQMLLYHLNGRHVGGNLNRVSREPKVITRTGSRRHYRMLPITAQLLGIETVEPSGAHTTEPPTVLAKVDETLHALEARAAGTTAEEVHSLLGNRANVNSYTAGQAAAIALRSAIEIGGDQI